MTPPFLDEGVALTDTERPARPREADQLSGRRLGLFLVPSLVLHILTAAAALGFFSLQTGGVGGVGSSDEHTVFMVSLAGGTGDSHLDEAGHAGPGASEEAPADPEPLTEEAEAPAAETAVLLPEPDAISLEPKAKTPPALPKTDVNQRAPRKEAKTAAGQGDNGPAESAGSGTGQKGASGGGGSGGYIKGHYDYIKKRIRQHLVYSPQAKRMGIQGTVTVSFAIEKDGRARDIAVSKTSGHASLDESAMKAVRNASPFPPPPDTARIAIPISFSLK